MERFTEAWEHFLPREVEEERQIVLEFFHILAKDPSKAVHGKEATWHCSATPSKCCWCLATWT